MDAASCILNAASSYLMYERHTSAPSSAVFPDTTALSFRDIAPIVIYMPPPTALPVPELVTEFPVIFALPARVKECPRAYVSNATPPPCTVS